MTSAGEPPPVEPLDPAADGASAVDVLCEAFAADATLRWCFLADEPGYEERLRGYMEVGHRWHTGAGQPVLGIRRADWLVGVLYLMTPSVQMTPEAGEALRQSLVARCGVRAAGRFFRYDAAVSEVEVPTPVHTLALVGVRPGSQGHGLGSALVRAASALCDADPHSRGVLLDTGSERGVRFYERHGYEGAGRVRVPDQEGATGGRPLEEFVLFRPRGPALDS